MMASPLLTLRDGPPPSTLLTRTVAILGHLVARADDDVDCKASPHLCEKPAVSSTTMTYAIVGSVLGLLIISTVSIMLYFHLKRRKREKSEDLEDQFQMSDYGLDDGPVAGRSRGPKPPTSQRLSFDDLPQPGMPKRTANPFDDTMSDRSADDRNPAHPSWPKRVDSSTESSQTDLPKKM